MDETFTLADLRRNAGLSQPQLADRMGVSRNQVSRIEAKYPDVMFTTVRSYMDALGMDIRFVGGGTNVESSCVTDDPTRREYAESVRRDPTRRGSRTH